jgi:hypothetical protein
MPACDACNRGTSAADLAASIVSSWNYYSTLQEDHDHSKLIAQVRKYVPDLMKEWSELAFADPDEKEEARQHLRKYGMHVQHDAAVISIGPVTIRLLNLFAHKAVLALHFEHSERPLSTIGRVCAYWKTKCPNLNLISCIMDTLDA